MSAFDAKKFAKHLRSAREELGITQAELGARTGAPHLRAVSVPYISALERAMQKGRPSDPFLVALAWGLKKDPNELREWAGIEPAPDWSPTLKAIKADRNLSEEDQELISDIYLRLAPSRRS